MAILEISPEKLSKLKPPYIFLDTIKKSSQNQRSFLFSEAFKVLELRPDESPLIFFKKAESFLERGYWLCGFFSYEFGYFLEEAFSGLRKETKEPLAWLLAVKQPKEVIFTGEKEAGNYYLKNLKPNISFKRYKDQISKIKAFLRKGLTYQVNYTFKVKFDFLGDVFSLYQALRNTQQTAYASLINIDNKRIFLSFSPELFFRYHKNKIEVEPMKGTVARGISWEQDRNRQKELVSSPKIKAENLMIVDLLRSDLGRISHQVKTLKLFHVEKYKTLYQMTSKVEAELVKKIPLKDVFASLFPSGSVTGAPKIKTMQLIRELEEEPRGIYTGAIGYISPKREACFNVAIRTIDLNNGKGKLGVGGGIVYDSKKEAEYKEALLKGEFLIKTISSFRLIETLLWSRERGFWLLKLHLQRLKKSCAYFKIPFYLEKIEKELKSRVQGRKRAARVRILIDTCGKALVKVSQLNRVKPPVKVKINNQKVNNRDSFLYHKTSQRRLYNQEIKRAACEGFFETIFLNQKDELTEGTFTNIFIKKGEKLYTPPVASGLLPGVLRQHLLCQKRAVVKKLYLKDLKEADKIYLGNSVRGLLEVRELRK